MRKSTLFLALPVLALAALTACGGGRDKSSTTTTTTQSQPAASPAENSTAAGSMAGAAAVPGSLHCGATAPVWANMKSHVYHTAGDPLYGKTKHGEYMCASTAMAQGYHAAGMKGREGGMMRGKHHHKKSGTMMAQPEPSPT